MGAGPSDGGAPMGSALMEAPSRGMVSYLERHKQVADQFAGDFRYLPPRGGTAAEAAAAWAAEAQGAPPSLPPVALDVARSPTREVDYLRLLARDAPKMDFLRESFQTLHIVPVIEDDPKLYPPIQVCMTDLQATIHRLHAAQLHHGVVVEDTVQMSNTAWRGLRVPGSDEPTQLRGRNALALYFVRRTSDAAAGADSSGEAKYATSEQNRLHTNNMVQNFKTLFEHGVFHIIVVFLDVRAHADGHLTYRENQIGERNFEWLPRQLRPFVDGSRRFVIENKWLTPAFSGGHQLRWASHNTPGDSGSPWFSLVAHHALYAFNKMAHRSSIVLSLVIATATSTDEKSAKEALHVLAQSVPLDMQALLCARVKCAWSDAPNSLVVSARHEHDIGIFCEPDVMPPNRVALVVQPTAKDDTLVKFALDSGRYAYAIVITTSDSEAELNRYPNTRPDTSCYLGAGFMDPETLPAVWRAVRARLDSAATVAMSLDDRHRGLFR